MKKKYCFPYCFEKSALKQFFGYSNTLEGNWKRQELDYDSVYFFASSSVSPRQNDFSFKPKTNDGDLRAGIRIKRELVHSDSIRKSDYLKVPSGDAIGSSVGNIKIILTESLIHYIYPYTYHRFRKDRDGRLNSVKYL